MMTVLVCSLSVGISLALCNETLSKENVKATKRQVKTFQVKTNQRKEQKFFNTGKSRGMCISLAILLRTPVCLLKQKSN